MGTVLNTSQYHCVQTSDVWAQSHIAAYYYRRFRNLYSGSWKFNCM